jgi:Ca2+-transporting ATPase
MLQTHALRPEELARKLGTDLGSGLSGNAIAERLARHGPNELPRERPPSILVRFLKQFNNLLVYVLFAAAGLSVLTGHGNDAYGIFIAILVRAVVGFFQERKAEQAVEKLRDMVVQEATVIRDGRIHRLPSRELVPGDILVLQEGDRVTADGRLFECKDLQTNEASLTGESTAVVKTTEALPAATVMNDRRCMVWTGTVVTSGLGKAIVVETGPRTAFGKIAASLGAIHHEKTPFEVRIDDLGRRLAVLSVLLSVVVFVVGYGRGFPAFDMFFFAVAMVVSVIPEGLPAVLAIVLAIGVQRMAKRNAVIRHMPSVETLGFADVICTDKTGTLTENKMTVREIITGSYAVKVTGEGWEPKGEFLLDGRRVRPGEDPQIHRLLLASAICNKASIEWRGQRPAIVGEPTEGALIVMAAKAGLDKRQLDEEYRLADEIPFSSVRKYRAVSVERDDHRGRHSDTLFVVGAFEVLSERSSHVLADSAPTPFDAAAKERFERENARIAGLAMRVLAVAVKELPDERTTIGDDDVSGLTFLGIVGMIDPPRSGVADAVHRCRDAGVRVIMITGDHKATAVAVAREIGLLPAEGFEGAVFTEHDVAGLDDASFREAVDRAVVFARVTPETKLRAVTALQARGHTVAMTGDGVNDAPALKKASIGVAMGITGTDVTKEVAGMVLADDNFVSIVNAIEEGRIVFRNVKQTTAYLFTTNVGEVVTVLASLLMGLPLPLLPAQILWMNLVTDGFPDIALATEGVHGNVLAEPPRSRKAQIISKNVLILTGLCAAVMAAGTIAIFTWALTGGSIDRARTLAFTAMAAFQLWNVFNMRSARQSLFKIGFFSNRNVIAAVAIALGLQSAVLYLPGLQRIFQTVPLGAADWAVVIATTSTVFFAVELFKLAYRRGWIPRSWA